MLVVLCVNPDVASERKFCEFVYGLFGVWFGSGMYS
jgi:hypothetical protein